MDVKSLEFLKSILETPSPSGFERPVQDLVRSYVAGFAESVRTDTHGNVFAANNPKSACRVMLAGHCDQIGMIVSQIDEQGFIYAQTIGGWDPQQLIGQRMTIWSKSGPIPAVIARKPIHLLTPEERKQVVKLEDLWLDIGARDQKQANEAVTIGDAVTLKLGYQTLRNNFASSPGMDNKTGLWVVMEALRRSQDRLNCSLVAVSTVQEEVGLRGSRTSAFEVDPRVGIAVDVTHATDCPTIDKRQNGDISLGAGPVIACGPNMNPVVVDMLVATAERCSIPFQRKAVGRAAPNDANSIQISRSGVATGLVAIPNRYMHSAVETISLDDINHAATLLAEFATSLTGDEDFTP